jgi:hypothetical protein
MIASTPTQWTAPASAVRNKDVVAALEFVSSVDPKPVAELFNNSNQMSGLSAQHVNNSRIDLQAVPEWTTTLERKFVKLAHMKALGLLQLGQLADFERMSAFRRAAAHPRSGEEIVAEYEQRTVTQDLVMALMKYVEFHRHHSAHSKRKTS